MMSMTSFSKKGLSSELSHGLRKCTSQQSDTPSTNIHTQDCNNFYTTAIFELKVLNDWSVRTCTFL